MVVTKVNKIKKKQGHTLILKNNSQEYFHIKDLQITHTHKNTKGGLKWDTCGTRYFLQTCTL